MADGGGAVEGVIDGRRLREQLTAAANDGPSDEANLRRRGVAVLRDALSAGRDAAAEGLAAGAGGFRTAQALSRVADEIITALYDFTTVHVFRARNPTEAERIAVVATGGYGRGLLAPFSDVDLLFLRPYKATPHGESVIEFMLYALWDLGFKVGQASRTVTESLKLACGDFTIRTSLVDARYLAGDPALAEDLKRRFRVEIALETGAEFVAAKLKERDERHAKAGATRYLVEPNVKDGKGGLRDLNTLFWIAQYLHPAESEGGVVPLAFFAPREREILKSSVDFMWAVRCHLHFVAGRAEERLSFDFQPEVARRMGFEDRGDEPAVERFMRRYFTTSKQVGALTRVFCAKLEAEQEKAHPSGLSRFWPIRRRQKKALAQRGFLEDRGRITVAGPQTFTDDPVNLIRLFRLSDQYELDLHPDAVTEVHRHLKLISPPVRRDPETVEAFLDILARGKRTYRTLTQMNEAGVLGRLVPEFGRVVGQMQFNMYHAYTVDEHTLRAVRVIADIAAGRVAEDFPLSVQIMPLIADREALFLAMLLHDTGKGGEDGQEIAGARAAEAAGKRLGLEPERIRLVSWLVLNHLVMSDFAQKRDVQDPQTVADFAAIVETPERLRMLLVLTVADISAVGPGVWNGWKGQLLRELYTATEAVFRGGWASSSQERAEGVRTALAVRDPAASAFAAEMGPDYLTGVEPDEVVEHARLVARAAADGGSAASGTQRLTRQATEVVVAARDRLGLFADLAGAIAATGASIVGARVHTSPGGQALDVFHIQEAGGARFGEAEPRDLQRLLQALERAARGEPLASAPTRLPAHGRAAAFSVSPVVIVDNSASAESTVVETSGRDRPGLLAALAQAIATAGLSIHSAHIDNYGAMAVDVFYVREPAGGKLSPDRAGQLRAALLAVLGAGDAAAPSRPGLRRARASAVR